MQRNAEVVRHWQVILHIDAIASPDTPHVMLVGFTGTPFELGLAAIITKIEKSLSQRVRAFLKKLPDVVQEKTAPPTFSVHSNRVRKVTLLDRTFAPVKDLTTEAFGHSLDVNRGKPERIQIRFGPRVASYVRERTWHASQQLDVLPGGGVRLTLEVCRDWALLTWILGWGAHARVLAPSALAEEILAQLDEARDGYVPKLAFETSRALLPPQARRLPLRG